MSQQLDLQLVPGLADRVSITFIMCVGRLGCAELIMDSDTIIHTDKFDKPKPLALLYCHWFHDIHHANTSPTYYI